ncbi:D-alanyl-D-alanine carboxypeptidase/D-alanyl-D-alanine-endopeptidase [Xylanimonas oleitrophica]|uniref:D-alanyl-D-alanine carboxypeptidase/D-alanyl-D-alanine-endopeptidase n=1 Tax=Xylanimonas oleitrophica TaxID=2607479 RepID=A0A2W5WKK9_9MICO|nr:D-alanyl-D-alanine carboxypeptidase/D-alanyl-D-alanine-endopeptidase [Xylanimonas oleitrophica]PZR51592.1 D-alanyl-D-alanine carboxypeptidase/D-alanyl-D-alanine-endopeptidase [Xylanimonas oleitrophica]
MGWRVRTGATVVGVLALLGGYLVADAYDVVPGMLTVSPPPEQPAPFPSAPGARPGPSPSAVLADLPADAPAPPAAEVGRLVTAVASDERLGPRVAALVVDATSGDELGAANADVGLVPASTQKLLTAVAAITELGGDTTLDTRVVLDGDDRLVLVGGGDMMLAAGAGDPDAVLGRAGLGDLAAQVAARVTVTGRTQVQLALDDSLFSGPTIAPTVPPREAELGYVAPVASLAVNIARLTDAEYAPRSSDPAMAAAGVFADALAEHGLQVVGDVRRTTVPQDVRTLGTVRSAPLDQVVEYAMQHSDNTITEVLGRLVALDAGLPGSVEGSTKAVVDSVSRLGVDMRGAVLVDCSGLGRGSLMTVRQLVEVVRLTVDPARPALREVAVGMPVAGLSGTLANRYGGENPGRGLVRAKTGSLPEISGLAGSVVTADDRLLVFAFLADQIPEGGAYGARVIFDGLAGQLSQLSAT